MHTRGSDIMRTRGSDIMCCVQQEGEVSQRCKLKKTLFIKRTVHRGCHTGTHTHARPNACLLHICTYRSTNTIHSLCIYIYIVCRYTHKQYAHYIHVYIVCINTYTHCLYTPSRFVYIHINTNKYKKPSVCVCVPDDTVVDSIRDRKSVV